MSIISKVCGIRGVKKSKIKILTAKDTMLFLYRYSDMPKTMLFSRDGKKVYYFKNGVLFNTDKFGDKTTKVKINHKFTSIFYNPIYRNKKISRNYDALRIIKRNNISIIVVIQIGSIYV
jgi:hypothetical protein